MTEFLVLGDPIISGVSPDGTVEEQKDGALRIRDGRVVEVGDRQTLLTRHPHLDVVGSANNVVIPGFINAHHHRGLSTFQLGSPDNCLEVGWGVRIGSRKFDVYLDTLYGGIEQLESGITCVQHLHNRVSGTLEDIHSAAQQVLKAYRDVGIRTSFSYSVRDQNWLTYIGDSEFIDSLPPGLSADVSGYVSSFQMPLEDNVSLFDALVDDYRDDPLMRFQFAPANLHWCSDRALELIFDSARSRNVPLHMHLLESIFQREYGRRRSGVSAVEHLARLGLLGSDLTLAHCVWASEQDIELIGESDTNVCHNASSNLRTRGGIAPIQRFVDQGTNVAIGIDGATINDDHDMLQEMRVVWAIHTTAGFRDEEVLSASQVFSMATENAARTTPYGAQIGSLRVGSMADLVILDFARLNSPYVDERVPVLERVLRRGRRECIDIVIVGGEIVVRDGHVTTVDRDRAFDEVGRLLARPADAADVARQELARAVVPHLEDLYAKYADTAPHGSYYAQNSPLSPAHTE